MKKKTFLFLFVGAHVLFIVFQIDKQSRIVRVSYKKQKAEQHYKELETRKQALINQLYTYKNKKNIKAYAQDHLAMKPLKLHNVKKVFDHGKNA